MKRIHAYVSGMVQGVFFRYETKKKARELNIVGFAKNISDGRVEVVAEGEEDNLIQLVNFLHKGPGYAKVENVDIEWSNATNQFEDFSIRGW